jgi:hypothetical protein
VSKDNPTVNKLLTAIVKALETAGAHKITKRKQGVRCCSFVSTAVDAYISTLFCLASMDSGGGSVVQAWGSM